MDETIHYAGVGGQIEEVMLSQCPRCHHEVGLCCILKDRTWYFCDMCRKTLEDFSENRIQKFPRSLTHGSRLGGGLEDSSL
jgi:hypothetical protein